MCDYETSVKRAGGEPSVIDVQGEAPAKVIRSIDGLMLTGGGDVDPARYGEDRHPAHREAEEGRDEFELELIRCALEADIPVLAVCRGMQVLNVARGGTLVQDIPSQIAGALEHSLNCPPHRSFDLAHEVWISDNTKLWQLMHDKLAESNPIYARAGDVLATGDRRPNRGGGSGAARPASVEALKQIICDVNSRHHQAVNRVASGFEVSATAPDGVIEAMELPDARFCVAIQWHPENFWRTGEFFPLFEGFVKACSA